MLTEITKSEVSSESINTNNSEVNMTAIENESINSEVNVNEAVINSEEAKMEVQHPKEKKARRTALDKDIDKAKERIANASDPDKKARWEACLEDLLEEKAAKVAASKINKSDWQTKTRIKYMTDNDIERMALNYINESVTRGDVLKRIFNFAAEKVKEIGIELD